jgi:hypothetical protein
MTFVIGKTGYADRGNVTRGRVRDWLNDSQGKVCVNKLYIRNHFNLWIRLGLSIDIQTNCSPNSLRVALKEIMADMYHLVVVQNGRTRPQGAIMEYVHLVQIVSFLFCSISHAARTSRTPTTGCSPSRPPISSLQAWQISTCHLSILCHRMFGLTDL